MMLESYIEKNILRKVHICEHVFEFQEIEMDELADQLEVSTPTIQHDIESIIDQLDYCIESVTKDHHIYCIIFKSGISRSELTQTIYQSSYFLRFLAHYFEGEFSSTQLAEDEFISLSKVYAVKKIVLDFFKENGYLTEKQIIIPEFDTRNILLALTRYIDWQGYEQPQAKIQESIEELIHFVGKNFFDRRYCLDEQTYIIRGIEIAIGRIDHPIDFSAIDKKAAQEKPLFQLVKAGLEMQHELSLQETDIYFIFSLFNSRNYTNKTADLLKRDFAIVFNSFVRENPSLQELILIIGQKIPALDPENEIFQRAFLQLMRTTWADGQLFLPETLQLLTNQQKPLNQLIIEILNTWQSEHHYNLRWNQNLIRKFTRSISILLPRTANSSPKEIFIVSDNPFKQMYYRERLAAVVNEPHKINPTIYHSLDELKSEFLYSCERVVFCDTCVYHTGRETTQTTIIPISFRNIDLLVSELAEKLSFS